MGRWAWAEVDLEAVRHNVRVVRDAVAPAEVWAVVKADGYGHGSSDVARAAIDAGATTLCVALVSEGVELRRAGLTEPILILSEQPVEQFDELIAHDLTPTVYSTAAVSRLDARAEAAGRIVDVHLKIDTGMQRVGVDPSAGVEVARAIVDAGSLRLAGTYTHLACADEVETSANAEQLDRFDSAVDALRAAGLEPGTLHAANSAGALAIGRARHAAVRLGIAMYGVSPGAGVDHLCGALRPAMSLRARVSLVKRVEAGSHVSYGWRHRFERPTTIATVPAGYADGVPRRLGTLPDRPGAEVLIGGRRCPIVGVVTMDQFLVDVGDLPVAVGDEVVLIGHQGDESIRAEEWADRLGTIGYEVVCGISARVPRLVVGASPAP
ncbi:MAG: alanine racemase [Ilumatobacter sp.]|nr:alanine racemase [Ilumatobacter sp.]